MHIVLWSLAGLSLAIGLVFVYQYFFGLETALAAMDAGLTAVERSADCLDIDGRSLRERQTASLKAYSAHFAAEQQQRRAAWKHLRAANNYVKQAKHILSQPVNAEYAIACEMRQIERARRNRE